MDLQNLSLYQMSEEKMRWLAQRQSVVSHNIANANTPHYAAKDVKPFESVLQQTGFQMAATNPAHFTDGSNAAQVTETSMLTDAEVQQSGNSVRLEKELMKTGEVKRDYELNTGLVKAFHRMMLMTVRK